MLRLGWGGGGGLRTTGRWGDVATPVSYDAERKPREWVEVTMVPAVPLWNGGS
jgi:hypothetical protein